MTLAENRKVALEALSVLGEGAVVGDAAIYLFAKLPGGLDDVEVVRRLIQEHKVMTIPGSACGCPGYIRVAYANLSLAECEDACAKLRSGLQELMQGSLV
jgi:aromatic aminotransferase